MTDPGQRILPGADLGREVPLPPQPPLEDERDFLCCCPHNTQVESPDLPIPAEAIESAAKAACETAYPPSPNGRVKSNRSWEEIEEWERDAWRRTTEAALAAALPHLRSLQVETQIEFGRALGRKEAAEEIATAIERFLAEPHTEQEPCDQCDLMRLMARVARRIGKPTTTEGA